MAPPAFVRLAAHPVRWQLLSTLATGDYRVRELVELVGQPQNLVSYHLRLLREGELVAMRRSSFDARDGYYHLDLDRCAEMLAATGAALHPAFGKAATGAALHPAFGKAATGAALHPAFNSAEPNLPRQSRILFACTGNSARSPIAEALLRHRSAGAVEVTSAGSRPRDRIHPATVRVLAEDYGIDIAGQRPRHLETMTGQHFDYVISLCDKVREVFPEFPGDPRRVHWSIPEPTAEAAFRRTAQELDTRIGYLIHDMGGASDGYQR
ncbi:MAG TPA: ArsR family transcriptional regulator [Candidatus Limnocylindrales bacterium]